MSRCAPTHYYNMKLRVACVQFNPILGKVEANIAKVRSLLVDSKKEIDLLVLPELSLTGYNFKSPQDIQSYLEVSETGPSFLLAKELSQKFQCTTVIGYPENSQGTTYNSALVVNELGEVVYNYRKTHLYETDEAWGCSENPSNTFSPVKLMLGKGSQRRQFITNIGICMDLNPYKFVAPFNEFEFSLLCWKNMSRLIIVPTAWLATDSPSIKEDWTKEQKEAAASKWRKEFENNAVADAKVPNMDLINYWILRFFPFLSHPMNEMPRLKTKTHVILCNRTGIEDDVLYGGSSSILRFDSAVANHDAIDSTNPSVEVLESAGFATEEVIYHEIDCDGL